MNDSWYDTAQICTNGHMINSQSVYRPEHNKEFCDKCGAPTITKCQKCNSSIKGYYHVPIFIQPNYTKLPLPSFCPDCGKPYPWTEAKLKAAKELADELDKLSLEEREVLKKSLDDIMVMEDTPQTPVAATRFKRLVAKAGKVAADGLWFIIRDLVSETAKKIILSQ